jgi:hypothetical protein
MDENARYLAVMRSSLTDTLVEKIPNGLWGRTTILLVTKIIIAVASKDGLDPEEVAEKIKAMDWLTFFNKTMFFLSVEDSPSKFIDSIMQN